MKNQIKHPVLANTHANTMSEELKKSDLESRAPSAVSFVPTPDDKIFTEISEKVLKSRLNTKNKNSVRLIF